MPIKVVVGKPTQTKDNNEPGKYVRINKTSRPTAITLIDAKSLQVKKRKINQDTSSKISAAAVPMMEVHKMKKRKTFNHGDGTNNDTNTTVAAAVGGATNVLGKHKKRDDDNLCHNKGLKLKIEQQRQQQGKTKKMKKEIMPSSKLAKGMVVGGDGQCNQKNGGAAGANVRNEKNDGNHIQSPLSTGQQLTFREQLVANLKGSRFRFLNEMLYTTDGQNAANIFKEDPLAYKAYHDGYRQQVQQWPLNPLDRIIKSIRKMYGKAIYSVLCSVSV